MYKENMLIFTESTLQIQFVPTYNLGAILSLARLKGDLIDAIIDFISSLDFSCVYFSHFDNDQTKNKETSELGL